jgi:hypothetical protein
MKEMRALLLCAVALAVIGSSAFPQASKGTVTVTLVRWPYT